MCSRRFLCFLMLVFMLGPFAGSVASAAEYMASQALSIGDTYKLSWDKWFKLQKAAF
jgi:hypothetical protein